MEHGNPTKKFMQNTEDQKILTAVARIEFTEAGIPFNTVRESVTETGVRWAKEALLAIPSQSGRTCIEVCLESKNTVALNLARSQLEKFSIVESFSIEREQPRDKPSFGKKRPPRFSR